MTALVLAVTLSMAQGEALTIAEFRAKLDALASSPAPVHRVDRVRVGADEYPVAIDAADGSALQARIAVLRREIAALDRAPAMETTALRGTLDRVLAERRFAASQTSWQQDWRRRAVGWLAEQWNRSLGRRVAGRTIAMLLAWTISIGGLLLLAGWLVRLTSRRRRERPLALDTSAPRTPWRALAAEAAALARAGRTRDAVRLGYQAALQRLDEQGALRLDGTRTPREHLRMLPSAHRSRPALAALTGIFERSWYGSRASERDGHEIIALLQDLECLTSDGAIAR